MLDANAVPTIDDIHAWGAELDAVAARIGTHFARSETRTRVRDYLIALLGTAQRKNSWQLAHAIGDADPYGVQFLLGRADWSADAVRDDLRHYVASTLGDAQGILVLDETGFVKKGTHSAGVQRQYTGTAGRVENAQVGVFLAYTSCHGTAFVDRELYMPVVWTDDLHAASLQACPGLSRSPPKVSWPQPCSSVRSRPT